MKVLDFTLRTPGIFLQKKDKSMGGVEINLFLEIWKGNGNDPDYTSNNSSDWQDINEVKEIRILADTPNPDDIEERIKTQKLEVPYQNESSKNYKLLVPDEKTWYYRIVAVPCTECAKVFEDQIINRETIKVLVGKGSFSS